MFSDGVVQGCVKVGVKDKKNSDDTAVISVCQRINLWGYIKK